MQAWIRAISSYTLIYTKLVWSLGALCYTQGQLWMWWKNRTAQWTQPIWFPGNVSVQLEFLSTILFWQQILVILSHLNVCHIGFMFCFLNKWLHSHQAEFALLLLEAAFSPNTQLCNSLGSVFSLWFTLIIRQHVVAKTLQIKEQVGLGVQAGVFPNHT